MSRVVNLGRLHSCLSLSNVVTSFNDNSCCQWISFDEINALFLCPCNSRIKMATMWNALTYSYRAIILAENKYVCT